MGNDTVAVPFAIVANNRKAGVYLAETIVGAFLLRFIYPCVGHGVCFMVNMSHIFYPSSLACSQ